MLFGLFGSSSQSQQYELGQPLSGYPRPSTRPGSVVILILGRSGIGKSQLISAVCPPGVNESMSHHGKTTQVTTYRSVFSGTKYKIIDTPGFDNTELNDVEICARIIKYLRESTVARGGIHGIIYIHQSGDPLQSGSFDRYLTAISHVFFGSLGPRRLTIFFQHVNPHTSENMHIENERRNTGSTLGRLCGTGAKFVLANDQTKEFITVVESYAGVQPSLLPIQWDRPNIITDLEDILYKNSTGVRSSDHEERIKRSYERKLQDLHSILDAKDNDLAQYRDAFHRTETLRVALQESEATLRKQLQQTQREYSSLRSELQLQENFEQSDIVQELEDLNRHIDDISRSIAAHWTDNHVRPVFNKDPAEVTSLDVQDRPGLLKLLGLDEDKCSLASSAEGKGLDIENFLDFTIRNMLCNLLFVRIFQPFHPAISPEQNHALSRAYQEIQKRESQTISGKWRSSTFTSIYEIDNLEQVSTWIDELLDRFTLEQLVPLMKFVFGSNDFAPDRQHLNQTRELMMRAWTWNSKLKGEVIVLGDFRQTIHTPYSKFDPSTMKDFEPQPNAQPISVLGTIGLGLVSLRAVGGRQSPEETLVCKATVITNTLYA
ncbi:unnamed protein product [Rhizoctonia solani]|uniref:G domain-containing protein n=1 Tax=Rhizoctonia solani TaxID=456999 RepID=A0A8H3CQ87_9AGAM|nr:unnamed protein product [Rhizoctonia solani]